MELSIDWISFSGMSLTGPLYENYNPSSNRHLYGSFLEQE